MAFDPSVVEDGTGRRGALVYEQVAAACAWLSTRGLTALSSAESAAADVALLRATEAAEIAVKPYVRGRQRFYSATDRQGLIFPAVGAYLADGTLLNFDELPSGYVEGIRLLAEAIAAGRFMPQAGRPPGITRESTYRGGEIDYRPGTDFSSLASNHPEEWRKISTVIPPMF